MRTVRFLNQITLCLQISPPEALQGSCGKWRLKRRKLWCKEIESVLTAKRDFLKILVETH